MGALTIYANKTMWTARKIKSREMKRPMIDKQTLNMFQGAALFSRLAYNDPMDVWKGISPTHQDIVLKWIEADTSDELKITYIDAHPLEDTQLYICKHEASRKIVVSFRGTANARDALTALNIKLCGVEIDSSRNWVAGRNHMKIHTGFLKQYLAIRQQLLEVLTKEQLCENDEIVITGHSLGGALANLAAIDIFHLCKATGSKVNVVTFGAPRVGNNQFVGHFQNEVLPGSSYRIFKDRDPIPQILMSPHYSHVEKGICLDDTGNLKSQNDWECVMHHPYVMFGTLDSLKFLSDHSTQTYIDLLCR
jgi:hypothetical protein